MPFTNKAKQRAYQREYQRKRRRTKSYNDTDEESVISPAIKTAILVIILLAASMLSILAFFDLAGPFGLQGKEVLARSFGWGAYAFPIFLTIIALLLLKEISYRLNRWQIVGVFLFFGSLLGILHHAANFDDNLSAAASGIGGGYVGFALQYPFSLIAGYWGAWVFLGVIAAVGLVLSLSSLLFGESEEDEEDAEKEAESEEVVIEAQSGLLSRLFEKLRVWKYRREYNEVPAGGDSALEQETEGEEESEEAEEETTSEEAVSDDEVPEKAPVVAKKRRNRISIPIDLLESSLEKPSAVDVDATRENIEKTFATFGINVEMGEVNVGPTVTQYTLRPPVGVKLSRITGLSNELSLALAAHPLRMEAPIPGKSLVGIELPNKAAAKVKLKDILLSSAFKTRSNNLSICLGKDVSGKAWIADLAKMPHLLIAGSTGSGKSVAINTLIVSLMYQNSPDDLKFVLVDPKKVELTMYNDIPYLLTPVITDVKNTVNALKWVVGEMERRYQLLSNRGKRNIESYNEANKNETIPTIVFVIDELADLMAVAANEVEGAIVRLAQMARAVGIHLVLATQRPSVNVLTGLIKANVPSRIAFAVPSQIDSRTILDVAGAEKLLGRGDMLFTGSDSNKPRRLQGPFLDDAEIERVVNFLKEQDGEVEYQDEIVERQRGITTLGGDSGSSGEDDLYDEARDEVVRAGKASASLLQRRLRVGYARAARILDLLEAEGIIGPADGARPREILITSSTPSAPDAEYPEEVGGADAVDEEEIETEAPDKEEETPADRY